MDLIRQRRTFSAHPASIVELLNVKPGERVLDVGCGMGIHSAKLQELGAHVFPVDVERSNLRVTSALLRHFRGKKVPEKLPWKEALRILRSGEGSSRGILARAEALPFKDESFDAVVMLEVLQHIRPDSMKLHALREIHRVLKKGGRALVYTTEYEKTLPRIMEKIGFRQAGGKGRGKVFVKKV